MTGNEVPGHNLFTVAHNPQQHQEEVDEIKIEGEGADDGAFAHYAGFEASGLGQGHVFQSLGVVDGQTDEEKDPNIADDHRHARAPDKEVDHRGDDDADQAHEKEATEAGQVFFGGPAVDAAGNEGSGTHEKRRCDRGFGVGQKHRRECCAVKGRIQHEKGRRGRGLHLADARAEREHHHELSDDQAPEHDRVAEDDVLHRLAVGNVIGHKAGQSQTDRHPIVDTAYERVDKDLGLSLGLSNRN